jgi:tRNA threonylcarbamoyladenosine biosynthesis protein TsaE
MSEETLYLSGELNDLQAIAKRVLEWADDYRIFAFKAGMGAGKTTFIKEICKFLGVVDDVTSPTFSLMNVYQDAKKNSIYHFDFYRIEDEKEALDIGIEDCLDSGNLCLIEWSENIERLLAQEKHIEIQINILADERLFRFEKINS